MTLLIGDVHGKWHMMNRVVSNTTQDVVCVGDVGIGFTGEKDPVMPSNFKFIRGNHDNPEIISKQPGFLGDYGMTKYGFFVVGGADSIDKDLRTPGIDWWSNEQMSYTEMAKCREAYNEAKPDIVVSHEAPFFLHGILHAASVTLRPSYKSLGEPRGNSTAFLLDTLFLDHRPKMWYFGHWHTSLTFRQFGITFRFIDELETVEV